MHWISECALELVDKKRHFDCCPRPCTHVPRYGVLSKIYQPELGSHLLLCHHLRNHSSQLWCSGAPTFWYEGQCSLWCNTNYIFCGMLMFVLKLRLCSCVSSLFNRNLKAFNKTGTSTKELSKYRGPRELELVSTWPKQERWDKPRRYHVSAVPKYSAGSCNWDPKRWLSSDRHRFVFMRRRETGTR